jgi:hypothetical protein
LANPQQKASFPIAASGNVLSRRILLREFLFALIPLAALIIVLESGNLIYLDYVHVITGGTWTGIDLFMGLVMSRVMRSLSVPERAEVAKRLTPKTLFLLPSLASVAITAGIYMAITEQIFSLQNPWIIAAGIVVVVLTVQGFGFLLPNSVRILLEATKDAPDVAKIAKWNMRNLRMSGSQAIFQIAIIFIMANLAI